MRKNLNHKNRVLRKKEQVKLKEKTRDNIFTYFKKNSMNLLNSRLDPDEARISELEE